MSLTKQIAKEKPPASNLQGCLQSFTRWVERSCLYRVAFNYRKFGKVALLQRFIDSEIQCIKA